MTLVDLALGVSPKRRNKANCALQEFALRPSSKVMGVPRINVVLLTKGIAAPQRLSSPTSQAKP
jgi:hypothetical protein